MNGIEGPGTMLGVETDRIDHGEGLFDGLENRSVIVHIGADRFESGSFVREHSPGSFGMTRCDPHRVSAVEQTANNAMAEKADRKSTRLNSSHLGISYAVFCLTKK